MSTEPTKCSVILYEALNQYYLCKLDTTIWMISFASQNESECFFAAQLFLLVLLES
jgi:hypothetical protein